MQLSFESAIKDARCELVNRIFIQILSFSFQLTEQHAHLKNHSTTRLNFTYFYLQFYPTSKSHKFNVLTITPLSDSGSYVLFFWDTVYILAGGCVQSAVAINWEQSVIQDVTNWLESVAANVMLPADSAASAWWLFLLIYCFQLSKRGTGYYST